MIERRRHSRFELKVGARYKIADSEDIFRQGRTKNISAEGICFESDAKLKIGTHITIEIDLEDKKPSVVVVGEIVWSSPVKTPGFHVEKYDVKGTDSQPPEKYLNGIKLIDLSKTDEGRFLKYYCDRMVEKLSKYLKIRPPQAGSFKEDKDGKDCKDVPEE